MLTEKTDSELLELLNDDANVLAFVIEQWKSNISAVPKLTQAEVYEFFEKMPISAHYLRDKPVEEWDDYDVSNYYFPVIQNMEKTRRVFAIYTSDVKEEDKYVVTTQPSFLFLIPEKEAEEETRAVFMKQGLNKWDSLKIMSLWKIEA